VSLFYFLIIRHGLDSENYSYKNNATYHLLLAYNILCCLFCLMSIRFDFRASDEEGFFRLFKRTVLRGAFFEGTSCLYDGLPMH